jgi:hypothetical protein
MTNTPLPPDQNTRSEAWKSQTYLIGGTVGLVLGLLSAYLFARSAQENNPDATPARIGTGDILRIGLATLTLIRQVADLSVDRSKPTRGR